MSYKIFGFDIGITSIGWAVIEFDEEYFDIEKEKVTDGKLIAAGVRTFSIAEVPKTGASLASVRRASRLSRRRTRRRARRMKGIKNLFIATNIIAKEGLKDLFDTSKHEKDVWELRTEALERKLEKEEFLRVLVHLAKHRGFKSIRKSEEENDKEGGKVLKAISANKAALGEKEYLTLAQMFIKERKSITKEDAGRSFENLEPLRNRHGSYGRSIPRELIEEELSLIFKQQKAFGNKFATDELHESYRKIAFRQRDIKSVLDMVGKCQFERGEWRAPKEAPSAELFVALQKINNFSVYENNKKRFLNEEECKKLLDILLGTKDVKYKTIRTKLFKDYDDIKFCDIDYPIVSTRITRPKQNDTDVQTSEKKTETKNPEDIKFYSMVGYHNLKGVIETVDRSIARNDWKEKFSKDFELLDKIVEVIAIEKSDAGIEKGLKELDLESAYLKELSKLSTKKFGSLSLKAIYQINPYLLKGLTYDKACSEAGYDFRSTGESLVNSRGKLLSVIEDSNLTTSPVVNRAVSQLRKVFNAIARKYGFPDQINIETARDINHSHDERAEIKSEQNKRRDERDRLKEVAIESGIDPSVGANLLKFELREQQNGKCIYSGKSIDIKRLNEIGYCEIDHIIPYSKCFDNGKNNLALCLHTENQLKRDRIPYDYFISLADGKQRWKEFEALVNSLNIKPSKKFRLLRESFTEEDAEGFKERNINDTRYIARYIKKYFEDGLDFNLSDKDIKNRIQTRSGSLTDFLRRQWGFVKDRDESDKHHALDAIIIACATQGMVKYLSTVSGIIENKVNFARYKGLEIGEPWYKGLKNKFKSPWDGFRNDVENILSNIFVSRASRKKATGAAHKDTIYPLNANEGTIEIRGGKTDRDNMFRYDVFEKECSFFIVPIYVADTVNKDFVDVAQPGNIIIDESFKFRFSLYKDDLIEITQEGGTKYEGYISQYNAQSGQFHIESVDRSRIFTIRGRDGNPRYDKEKKLNRSTFVGFRKFFVDPLGQVSEVKREKRTSVLKKSVSH